MRVYTISLGCPKNRVDTERLLAVLGPGVEPVDSLEHADLAVINTCGFIEPAVKESVQTIVQAVDAVSALKLRPALAVAGCLVSRYGASELAAELPEVDLWLPAQELETWPERISKFFPLPETLMGRRLSTGPSYAYLKTSEGCQHACSFCTIPSIRGPLASAPVETLQDEAAQLLALGVKELVLVAQDLTAYGIDMGAQTRLPGLLDALLPLPGLERLRLMYLYPAGLTRELLGWLAQAGPPLVPYFDVPLQHAHPDILQAMGRPFARDPRRVVDRIRDFFPHAALRTSLITGFPGEKPRHFKELLRFVEETRFLHLGVFPFWPEEGTPAATLPDQVGERTRNKRREELMALQKEMSEQLLEEWTGCEEEVLVDAVHPEWPGLHVGRTWFQAPEVDGVTYVSGAGVAPGAMVKARLEPSGSYDLSGLV